MTAADFKLSQSRRSFVLVLTGALLAGCRSAPTTRSNCGRCGRCETCRSGRHLQGPTLMHSSADDPEVVIIGVDCPPTMAWELQYFTDELRRGLAACGGLRMRDSVPWRPASDCDLTGASPAGATCTPPAAILSINHETTAEDDQASTLILPPPLPAESTPEESTLTLPTPPANLPAFPTRGGLPLPDKEIRVVMHDFRPYRPMLADVTIFVRDVATGQELTAIQGVWHGKEPREPVADASPILRRALKLPPPRADIEVRSLVALSPRLFLSGVAKEILPSLHAACLTSINEPVTGFTAADWSALPESDR